MTDNAPKPPEQVWTYFGPPPYMMGASDWRACTRKPHGNTDLVKLYVPAEERDKLRVELKTMTEMWKALSDKLGEVRADNERLREMVDSGSVLSFDDDIRTENKKLREDLAAVLGHYPECAPDGYGCGYGCPITKVRERKPTEPETKTVAVPAGQGYEAPIAGIAAMKRKPE